MLATDTQVPADWQHLRASNDSGSGVPQVYQTVSAYTARLDNVVELYSRVNLPQIPGLPDVEPVITTLTLRHLYEPLGGSTSQITFEDTEVKTTGTGVQSDSALKWACH